MKRLIYTILVLLTAHGFSGCNKFLDVKPKGIVIPEKLSDYEAILNSYPAINTFSPALLYCTDDYYGEFDEINRSIAANAYFWRKGLDPNEKENPAVWGEQYRSVYNTNIIINNVMGAKEGSEAKKQSIRAEAWVIRAECYFNLLTVFAKAYNPATASNDPGLPLVNSTDVTDKAPARSSVQAVLDTIIDNLTEAITYLPAANLNRYRATKYAAHGMLSRIYLYMGDYSKAAMHATEALKAPHSFLDYNDYASSFDLPESDVNPEILWQRASEDYTIPGFLLISDDLKSYYKDNDLRYEFFTGTNNDGLYFYGPPGTANFGITFQEMELTRAEVLARQGHTTDAMDIINDLRKYRIISGEYVPLTAVSPDDALSKVLAERRVELAFGGQRWMDMKRLDREGMMPEVKRIDRESGVVRATLPPHSPQYTFEIPARVLQFNPGMIKNF